jgi:hypothetical protein
MLNTIFNIYSGCILIGSLIGGTIGWILNQWRLSAEIAKLKQETIKFAGENLSKVQEKRMAYNNACVDCKLIAVRLIDELKSQAATIVSIREELCTALCSKVIPLYVDLIEWENLLNKNKPEKLKILMDDVVAELRRHKEWIRIINNSQFVNDKKLTPLKVSKRTLSPFMQLLEDLSSKDKSTVEPLLRNVVNEIISEGL